MKTFCQTLESCFLFWFKIRLTELLSNGFYKTFTRIYKNSCKNSCTESYKNFYKNFTRILVRILVTILVTNFWQNVAGITNLRVLSNSLFSSQSKIRLHKFHIQALALNPAHSFLYCINAVLSLINIWMLILCLLLDLTWILWNQWAQLPPT